MSNETKQKNNHLLEFVGLIGVIREGWGGRRRLFWRC